jgi:hypothetical protein
MEKWDEASIDSHKKKSSQSTKTMKISNVHCVSVGKGDTVAKHTFEAKYKCTSRLQPCEPLLSVLV